MILAAGSSPSKADARAAVAAFIEEYNTTRLYAALAMLGPITYERSRRGAAA